MIRSHKVAIARGLLTLFLSASAMGIMATGATDRIEESVSVAQPDTVRVQVLSTIVQEQATLDVAEVAQPKAISEPVSESESKQETEPARRLWGKCRITAYCPCEKCCGAWATKRPIDPATGKRIVYGASGKQLQTLKACASSLPFGTKLYIPELDLTVTVEDRAAKSIDRKYNGMYVDLYIDNHDQCFSYLSGHNDYMEVYIIE